MKAFEMLAEYFSYEFTWFALIAGTLIALCSSLFGVAATGRIALVRPSSAPCGLC